MKRVIVIIIVLVAAVGGVLWLKQRSDVSKSAGEAATAGATADAEAEGPKITHDATGNVVIEMSDDIQGDMGIVVKHPVAVQLSPELKGYGRVLDPSPLASLMIELASARAAYAVSSSELARLKTLAEQGNASTRSVQAAEATALHDELAVRSARDHLALSCGKAVAERSDLPAFTQSLTSQNSVLVRIDLPVGETLKSPPIGARIVSLSGNTAEAEFLGMAPSVDPQMLSRGCLFLVKLNAARFLSGEAVTGYLKLPGEPLAGVVIPREAVVRTEGAGWIYVLGKNAESFTRFQIALDHSTDDGWFVTHGATADDFVVTTGAQELFSEERKGQGGGGD